VSQRREERGKRNKRGRVKEIERERMRERAKERKRKRETKSLLEGRGGVECLQRGGLGRGGGVAGARESVCSLCSF
jgi:hypothetical protein